MKTSERFTNAVTKLYNAFHKGELNAMDACCCAVGNICDNSDTWIFIAEYNMARFDRDGLTAIKKTGYSVKEILNIEIKFMYGLLWDEKLTGKENHNHKDEDGQFKGLCALVEYLCELEGIPNVMDYTILFETENNEPKYKLEEVLC